MNKKVDPDFWPKPIAHLGLPYLSPVDEHVIIAEISDNAIEGYPGMRQVYSCLIPCGEVDAVLTTPGGIGWQVESWGPQPHVGSDEEWDGSFWVDGAEGLDVKYEALSHGWLNHNRTVMLPDTAFLMCYGLVPRLLDRDNMAWDDPQKPVYDVVEVRPLSLYQVPNIYSPASVRVRRDYLEDYASLKGCAAAAVYYEERYSQGDPDIANAIEEKDGIELSLPGRRVCMIRVKPEHAHGADQLTRVWGCRLILKPKGRPITDEEDPDLIWPGGRKLRDFRTLESIVVRDNVLQEWESKDEFSVSPESGNVNYGGWWGTSRSYRIGRHHISVELAKLYEGTPAYVVQHFHRFAVPEEEFERDIKVYGERHVGQRAAELIDAFFSIVATLVELSERVGEPYNDEALVGISREHVRYHGWWTLEGFKKLGHVIPLDLTRDAFLGRCMDLYQLLERVKPGPLKRLLLMLGLSAEDLKNLGNVGALRYLATLCQLATIARESGYGLITDFTTIRPLWDKDHKLELTAPVFALQSLRISRGHPLGGDAEKKLDEALKAFGLSQQGLKGGWGPGLDKVYDVLIERLNQVNWLIEEVSV